MSGDQAGGMDKRMEQLALERDYLLDRANQAGRMTFRSDRDVGVSSNAMVTFAITGERPSAKDFPSDPSDLKACAMAMSKAPGHLQERMRPLFEEYRVHVAERYPEILDASSEVHDTAFVRDGIPISEFISRIDEIFVDPHEDDRGKRSR